LIQAETSRINKTKCKALLDSAQTGHIENKNQYEYDFKRYRPIFSHPYDALAYNPIKIKHSERVN